MEKGETPDEWGPLSDSPLPSLLTSAMPHWHHAEAAPSHAALPPARPTPWRTSRALRPYRSLSRPSAHLPPPLLLLLFRSLLYRSRARARCRSPPAVVRLLPARIDRHTEHRRILFSLPAEGIGVGSPRSTPAPPFSSASAAAVELFPPPPVRPATVDRPPKQPRVSSAILPGFPSPPLSIPRVVAVDVTDGHRLGPAGRGR